MLKLNSILLIVCSFAALSAFELMVIAPAVSLAQEVPSASPVHEETSQEKTTQRKTAQQETPTKNADYSIYQTAGAPADPKVPARWNRYHDYTLATAMMRKLAETYPGHVRLQSLGKSHAGREMWVLTLSNFAEGDWRQKPAFWIDGGIHANEIQAVEVVLYTAWYLAEMKDRNPFITKLLNERTFFLLPMMSPDSRDAHMHRANTTHSPRSGQIPVDDDRDGRTNEDGPDDLDHDGHITQMRIKDPHGKYKPDADYPQMMTRVRGDEKGQYRMLGSEGIDNDGDGRINEDGDGYYDPNRDWPWNWQPASVQRGAYRYPLAIKENRLMADFVLKHPQIAGAQSYHNAAGMLLRGPGAKNDRVERADIAVYDRLGKQGEELLPGYRYLECATGLYEAYGTEFDWFYGMLGVFAFTNEMNTPYNLFGNKEDHFFGNPDSLHKFNKYLLFDEGFIPWHEVEHPRYGKIEVGGMAKNWVRQPASFMLEEELHRNMAFTLYHADQMPLVEIESVSVQQVSETLSEVTAVIVNTKLTPTHSAHDVDKRITPPDRIQLTGENLEVLTAFTAEDSFFEEKTEHARRPADLRIATIRRGEPVFVRWLVKGTGPYNVIVRTLKGGGHTRTLESRKEQPHAK